MAQAAAFAARPFVQQQNTGAVAQAFSCGPAIDPVVLVLVVVVVFVICIVTTVAAVVAAAAAVALIG